MRKLASVQKIIALRPIEGADKIEVAQILGWEVVVKKGEFKVEDLVVYVEIDSILPEKPEFEFLRERKFRVKTIKLKKQVSQGIAFPTSILPAGQCCEDQDVTDVLGVKKYDPQIQEENQLSGINTKKFNPVTKFMMGFAWFRFVYFKLNRKDKGWPDWIQKTDEDRIQVCAKLLLGNCGKQFYITEKVDGQSGTFYTVNQKRWGFKKLVFGVCSRNIAVGKGNNNYWNIAQQCDLEKKMLALKKDRLVIQGEIVGGKIQGNKYKINGLELFVFNVVENGRRYTLDEMVKFCNNMGLKTVPIIQRDWRLFYGAETVESIKRVVDMSVGTSILYDVQREGLVFRLADDPRVSFKVINPEFLLKFSE